MMKAKRKNNKGFTLVEMIIVIAVMSILAIVVSPQLISYIEKARRGTDRQAIWESAHAAQVAYVANSEDIDDTEVMVIINNDGIVSYGNRPTDDDTLDNEVDIVLPADSYKYKSNLYRGKGILIKIDEVSGLIDISALDYLNGEIGKVDDALDAAGEEGERLDATEEIFIIVDKYTPDSVKNQTERGWQGALDVWNWTLGLSEGRITEKKEYLTNNESRYNELVPEGKTPESVVSALQSDRQKLKDDYYESYWFWGEWTDADAEKKYNALSEDITLIQNMDSYKDDIEDWDNQKKALDFVSKYNSYDAVGKAIGDAIDENDKLIADLESDKANLQGQTGDYTDLEEHINELVKTTEETE